MTTSYLTTFFTNSGTPVLGLSASVNVRDVVNGSLIVSAALISELGDGFYSYAFSSYNATGSYAVRFNGGPTLSDADRYAFGTNDSFVEDVWDLQMSPTLTGSGRAGGMLFEMSSSITQLSGTINVISSSLMNMSGAQTQMSGTLASANSQVLSLVSTLALVSSSVDFTKKMTSGRWHITNNQMIFYDQTNSTEVARFNLFDSNGDATSTSPVERKRA